MGTKFSAVQSGEGEGEKQQTEARTRTIKRNNNREGEEEQYTKQKTGNDAIMKKNTHADMYVTSRDER